ncbi:hypothetical protein IB284_23620 [Ralstonia insidiosa]|nr:hypothetical protein [Ralstonia insidiosa]
MDSNLVVDQLGVIWLFGLDKRAAMLNGRCHDHSNVLGRGEVRPIVIAVEWGVIDPVFPDARFSLGEGKDNSPA